jgi:hypothetical protein
MLIQDAPYGDNIVLQIQPGPACPGAAGSPLYLSDTVTLNIGVLIDYATTCESFYDPSTDTTFFLPSASNFAMVTNGGTSWGFALKKLVAALP